MGIADLENIDWNFRGASTDYLTHGFHSYRAKFIPQIPAFLIKELSQKGDIVLDAFCGCGTTLVEARRLGRSSIGVDISPLACLITKVKTTAIEPAHLVARKEQFIDIVRERLKPDKCLHEPSCTEKIIPNFPHKEAWFHPKVLNDLGIIKAIIEKENDRNLQDFFNVCFSSILKSCSNQIQDYSYIADNMLPHTQRQVEVLPLIESKLNYMVKGAVDFYDSVDLICNSTVIGPQNANALTSIESDSVDLIVTSPPYGFTTDYMKMFRLSFYWMGWELDRWKREEIGARWKRGQKNAVNVYFEQLTVCLKEMLRVLRKGSYCCIVIGDSKRRKERLDIIKMLTNIDKTINSTVFCKKIDRDISSSSLPFQSVLSESILIFRKI
jgi:DNA modification methylase